MHGSGSPAACGVTITISGASGDLTATITVDWSYLMTAKKTR